MINVERSLIVTTTDGRTIVLGPKDRVTSETKVTYTCASGRCASRHDLPAPKTCTWIQEEVDADPSKMPSEAFSWLHFVQNTQRGAAEYVACSPSCLRDFLQYEFVPTPTKSPEATAKDPAAAITGDTKYSEAAD